MRLRPRDARAAQALLPTLVCAPAQATRALRNYLTCSSRKQFCTICKGSNSVKFCNFTETEAQELLPNRLGPRFPDFCPTGHPPGRPLPPNGSPGACSQGGAAVGVPFLPWVPLNSSTTAPTPPPPPGHGRALGLTRGERWTVHTVSGFSDRSCAFFFFNASRRQVSQVRNESPLFRAALPGVTHRKHPSRPSLAYMQHTVPLSVRSF